jgi:hypothetical protein
LTFLLITILINPVIWKEPVGAAAEALAIRSKLLQEQIGDAHRLAPGQVLESPLERSISLLANAFILPPSFHEVGNYASWTGESEAAYLARPESALFRGMIGGTVSTILFIFGLAMGLLSLRHGGFEQKKGLILFLAATIFQFAGILLLIPLPWQRYVLPFVPFVCLWTAIGLARLGSLVYRSANPPSPLPQVQG